MKERTEWECSNCGHGASVARGSYRFTESGLKRVLLQDVELIRCPKCKNVDPIIPNMNGLMQCLALAVVKKPWRLSGDEIRYLRKYLHMTGEQFAQLLGVDVTTLSKWENDHDTVGAPSDRLIRAVALTLDPVLRNSAEAVVRRFPELHKTLHELNYKINTETQEVSYA